MSDQMSDELDRARSDAGLSHAELWLRYFELGGMGGPVELEAYLHGSVLASDHEHDVLAHAINERLVELGGSQALRD